MPEHPTDSLPPDEPTLTPPASLSAVTPYAETLVPPGEAAASSTDPPSGGRYTQSAEGTSAPAWPRIPGHEILGELGRGGMGVVYKARHLGLNRLVAVKMILAGEFAAPGQRQRFLHESQAVARFQHPNIVQVHDSGEAAGRPYFSLEYVGGGALDRRLGGTPQPPRRAATLVETLARAMQYAHERGIVHRDLKPANVLLTENDTPKVTDFGLAKRLDSEGFSADGDVMGTPSYMAPEQASGKAREVGPEADVYALGAILYELLTGRPPFKGATLLETLEQVRSQDPVSPVRLAPRAPRDLVTVCLKCLEKEPRKRYPSAAELADDLRRFLDNKPIHARPTPAWERGWKWARRRPAVAALTALCLLTTVLGFALVTWKWREAIQARKDADGERDHAQQAEESEREQKENVKHALAETGAIRYDLGITLGKRNLDDGHPEKVAELLDLCPADLRRLEWHYLKHRLTGGRIAFHADDHHVECVAYSPDGRLLATGGGNPLGGASAAALKVWDAQSAQLLFEIKGRSKEAPEGHIGLVTGLAFSPDGRLLASATTLLDFPKMFRIGKFSEDLVAGEVKLWDAATGKFVRTLKGLGGVAFGPDGRLLVAGAVDGRIAVYDVASGNAAPELLTAGNGWPVRLAFSPDGKSLAVRYSRIRPKPDSLPEVGREMTVWDFPARRPLFSREGLGGGAFSPDGRQIAVVAEREIKILDARDGHGILSRPIPGEKAETVAFSPDGRLVAASGGRVVTVWDAASGAERAALHGHSGVVEALAFAPAGEGPCRFLASGGHDGMVNLWDLSAEQDGRRLAGHERHGMLSAVAFSRDGRLLAEANGDGALVNVWDVAAGKVVRKIPAPGVLSLAFSPDGRSLALGSGDGAETSKPGKVLVFDLIDEHTPVREFTGHTRFVTWVAYSPDGKLLASSSADVRHTAPGEVYIWDAASRKVICQPRCKDLVVGMAFGPDGRRLAVAAAESSIRLYDTADGTDVQELPGAPVGYNRVTFSPDGSRVAAGTFDGQVVVWDVAAGVKTFDFEAHSGGVYGLAFSPDGDRLATASMELRTGRGDLKLWDARTGQELITLPGQGAIAFSPDGHRFAAPTAVENTKPPSVTVWDATPSRELFALRQKSGEANSAAYSPDGTHIVTGHSKGSLVLWDAATGRRRRYFPAHDSFATRVAYSADGRRILSCGADKQVKIWDAEGGAIRTLSGHDQRVWSAAFSPDGRLVASGSADKTARLWDAESGKELFRLEHLNFVWGVAFSPDGKLLATACIDKKVHLWDVATGTKVRDFEGHAKGVTNVAFSPDGTRLASVGVDRAVKLWEVATGRELEFTGGPGLPDLPTASAVLAGAVGPDAFLRAACALNAARPPAHSGDIYGLAFSPDGRFLATAGRDRAARIWDLASGGPPVTLQGHTNTVFDVRFSPDGRRLATASWDGTVKVWDATPAAPGRHR